MFQSRYNLWNPKWRPTYSVNVEVPQKASLWGFPFTKETRLRHIDLRMWLDVSMATRWRRWEGLGPGVGLEDCWSGLDTGWYHKLMVGPPIGRVWGWKEGGSHPDRWLWQSNGKLWCQPASWGFCPQGVSSEPEGLQWAEGSKPKESSSQSINLY